MIKSLLFVPGDNPARMQKAVAAGADAAILDLEDAVAPANKLEARASVAAFLKAQPPGARRCALWVRINPFESGLLLADLTAVVPAAPDGIMLPKSNGPKDVQTVSHYLDALEASAGINAGSIRILPVATETASAPFQLGDYAKLRLERLAGLTWGAEDLSTALGASGNREANGELAFTYRLVRSMTLMAAHAAGVQAIETLYADFRDEAGLRTSSRAARAEGFSGRIAIHPTQVQAINESFVPAPEEIAHAEAVVAAFRDKPGAGAVSLNGQMLDLPHLKQAEAVLRAAAG